MNSFHGRTILIVGGASGIGLATAKRAAESGAKVIIAGRSRERLDAALVKLPAGEQATKAQAHVLDFTDSTSVASLAQRIEALDYLVLSAASGVAWGGFAQLQEEAVRAAFENKFWGYWRVTQALSPKLPTDGAIALVTGAAGRAAVAGTAGLAAVNGAIASTAQVLAVELAPRRINVISPGLTTTEAYDGMDRQQRETMFASAAAKLPAGRVGQPDDLAAAILFTLSNRFLTGAVLDVDGGLHLPRG